MHNTVASLWGLSERGAPSPRTATTVSLWHGSLGPAGALVRQSASPPSLLDDPRRCFDRVAHRPRRKFSAALGLELCISAADQLHRGWSGPLVASGHFLLPITPDGSPAVTARRRVASRRGVPG